MSKKSLLFIALSVAAVCFGLVYFLLRDPGFKKSLNGPKTIEDCLTNYDFEGARAIWAKIPGDLAKSQKLLTIVQAECTYYVKEGEYDKAFQAINESDFRIYKYEGNNIRYKLYEGVVEALIDKKNFVDAKRYAMKAPDDIWSEAGQYGLTTEPKNSMRAELLKRIEEFEKLESAK
jgi:hypothetical protein